MYPTMMLMAVAREMEAERRPDPHQVELRALALESHAQGFAASHPARGFAVRLLAGFRLRPRVS